MARRQALTASDVTTFTEKHITWGPQHKPYSTLEQIEARLLFVFVRHEIGWLEG